MSFVKIPGIKPEEIHIGCPCCSSAALVASMDMIIAVGFGAAYATRDNEVIYDGREVEDENWLTVFDLEKMAAADPDHDWRIVKYTPLHGETFQRHGPGQWICIDSNRGFA